MTKDESLARVYPVEYLIGQKGGALVPLRYAHIWGEHEEGASFLRAQAEVADRSTNLEAKQYWENKLDNKGQEQEHVAEWGMILHDLSARHDLILGPDKSHIHC